jgi:hypothetical protein
LISEVVGKIAGLVLAHCVLIGSELKDGELLVPLVIYYQDGVRKIETFEAETQQDAVNLAQIFLTNIPENVESWAYVQDGLITMEDGSKQDVFFINAWATEMTEPLRIYQMYRTNPFTLLDKIKVLNYTETGLRTEDANLFIDALDQGIYSHPSASEEQLQRWFK